MLAPRFLIPLNQGELGSARRVAVFNPEFDIDLDKLGQELVIELDDAVRYADFAARGYHVTTQIAKTGFDRALVVLSKHADLNKAMIARAWALVNEGGDILIEGAKTDGVDSHIRGLRALGLTPQVEPKSHGKIAWFKREAGRVGAIDAWGALNQSYVNQDGFYVQAGIFSAKAVDKGSAFFLETLRVPLKGQVADFGGGYGALSKAILATQPDIETLDIYETSYRALELAKRNVDDARANFRWASVQSASKAHYDAILSNPPFHDGRKGDPQLGLDFITAAARALRARGAFYMVANKHLPYEHRLNALFGHVEILDQSNAFKIFKATRPNTKGL